MWPVSRGGKTSILLLLPIKGEYVQSVSSRNNVYPWACSIVKVFDASIFNTFINDASSVIVKISVIPLIILKLAVDIIVIVSIAVTGSVLTALSIIVIIFSANLGIHFVGSLT